MEEKEIIKSSTGCECVCDWILMPYRTALMMMIDMVLNFQLARSQIRAKIFLISRHFLSLTLSFTSAFHLELNSMFHLFRVFCVYKFGALSSKKVSFTRDCNETNLKINYEIKNCGALNFYKVLKYNLSWNWLEWVWIIFWWYFYYWIFFKFFVLKIYSSKSPFKISQ